MIVTPLTTVAKLLSLGGRTVTGFSTTYLTSGPISIWSGPSESRKSPILRESLCEVSAVDLEALDGYSGLLALVRETGGDDRL